MNPCTLFLPPYFTLSVIFCPFRPILAFCCPCFSPRVIVAKALNLLALTLTVEAAYTSLQQMEAETRRRIEAEVNNMDIDVCLSMIDQHCFSQRTGARTGGG